MTAAARGVARPPFPLVLLGVVAVAVSLRGPIVAVTPVLPDIAADLGLGPTAVGLLATAPVVAFAVAAPLAALVSRRVGPEVAVLLALGGTLGSQLVRAVPTPGFVVVGTALLGLSITLGNVVVPVVIQRDVEPSRVSAVTGAYTAFLNVGSLLTALLTAPLAERFGWPLALALWAVLPAAGIVVWAVLVRRSRREHRAPAAAVGGAESTEPGVDPAQSPGPAEPATPPHASRRVLALRTTWLLAAAFGAQAFSYYAYTTWLPTYLVDETGLAATSAGALASTFQAWGILGALLVPVVARLSDLRWTAGFVGAAWVSLSLGVVLAPQALGLWLALGGLAQAGGFTVVFTGIALAARDSREATGMSAVVQTVGYLVAASSGPVIGALHAATGGWTLPLWVLVGTTSTFAVLSLLVAVHVERLRPVVHR
jgi:cyanate permease